MHGLSAFCSDAFCAAFIAHTLKEDMPPVPADIWDEVAYAHARMRMLARLRGGGAAVPDDTLRRALYLASRTREAGISERARRVRLTLAARAALAIGRDRPLRARQAYLRDCAAAAGCLARLIYPMELTQTDKEKKLC